MLAKKCNVLVRNNTLQFDTCWIKDEKRVPHKGDSDCIKIDLQSHLSSFIVFSPFGSELEKAPGRSNCWGRHQWQQTWYISWLALSYQGRIPIVHSWPISCDRCLPFLASYTCLNFDAWAPGFRVGMNVQLASPHIQSCTNILTVDARLLGSSWRGNLAKSTEIDLHFSISSQDNRLKRLRSHSKKRQQLSVLCKTEVRVAH